MEDASKQETPPVNPDQGMDSRPLLEGAELATQSRALFQSFNELLDHSLIVQPALENDPPDPDWPDKKTHFTVGEGENQIIYRINRKPVFDDADAEIGQELYLLRVDAQGNEEEFTVRIGQEPAIEYRGGMIETKFPVIFNSPDGSKTIDGTILTKRQVFSKKGAISQAIKKASRKDRYYAPDNSEEAVSKANEMLNRVRPELVA